MFLSFTRKLPGWNYTKKITVRNIERNRLHVKQLQQTGWRVLVLWECEVEKDLEGVKTRIRNYIIYDCIYNLLEMLHSQKDNTQ